MNNKSDIRKKYILIRKNIVDKSNKSEIIFKKLIELDKYKKAKVIGIYKALASEVNTDMLIDYSLKKRKIVLLPKVTPDGLVFYKNNSKEEFVKSDFGVFEPIGVEENKYSIDQMDLLIVPGVCFDKNKNRMGFGKGYYDRYIKNSDIFTIGICFEEQIIDNLIIEDTDVKMKMVLTDRNIYM